MSVRVGIVDGGFECTGSDTRVACARFIVGDDGSVERALPDARPLPHGESVAALVLGGAPSVRLIDARIATATSRPTPRLVAAALDWCVDEGTRVVNFSLGLPEDRRVLREACARAAALGVILVAATPARGAPVYPARYPGVLAVSGDARCGAGQWTVLEAAYGCCPAGPGGALGGASMATARFTGIVGQFITEHPKAGHDGLVDYLATFATWRGRESKRIAEIDS
jgi:hypothetical protein